MRCTEIVHYESYLILVLDSLAATSCAISRQRPLSNNDPKEIASLVSPWIDGCLSSHRDCAETIAGDILNDECGLELPTRVLRVNLESGSDSIKLEETAGLTGQYCALSHCWGSPAMRPLMTTRENRLEHISGISVSSLPRTFRDAVDLTRAIGVDYLWIDSLCIIQDDEGDWRQELDKMGSVYEKAFLVIAAAGSKDSTEGLFDIPRHPEHSIEVPYYKGIGSEGIFHLRMANCLEDDPRIGLLSTRGWSFQEWHLARRIVFFMPGGMRWLCKESKQDERGNGLNLDMRINIELLDRLSTGSWLRFLSLYSRSDLSVFTDRLPAVQGVANEIKKVWGVKYHLGLFDDDLARQLIWLQLRERDRLNEDQRDLPSWCWASIGGEKFFLDAFDESEAIPSVFLDSEKNVIRITGTLRQGSIFEDRINDCCFDVIGSNHSFPCPEFHFVRYVGSFALRGGQDNSTVSGLAMLDRELFSNVFVLPLVLCPRGSLRCLHKTVDQAPHANKVRGPILRVTRSPYLPLFFLSLCFVSCRNDKWLTAPSRRALTF